jgi:hypothetical protein
MDFVVSRSSFRQVPGWHLEQATTTKFPNPFQLFIHKLFYNSTLYNLNIRIFRKRNYDGCDKDKKLTLVWADLLLATGWTADGSEFESSRIKNFLFSTSSRPALRSTQPPIQWMLGVLSQRPGREADHLPLVPSSRNYGSLHLLPHKPSWRLA